jgi:isoleucyl-tRNA synthetase
MSTILERRAPFKDVFTYATLLAEDGRPMHKSWGNMIEFNEAADEMGVDVMRWLYCNHKPERDLIFGYHRADEVRRQFLIPLWNVYVFFVTYANIDGWTPTSQGPQSLTDLDRWIRSRLNQLIRDVSERLDKYEPDGAAEAVNVFLDDLSNWYLRRSRRRFWAKAGANAASDAEKAAAYPTLYQTLVTLSKLLAPFIPFVTEVIYQNLVRTHDDKAPESVHHCRWPEVSDDQLDFGLMQEMELVKSMVSLGHAARNKAQRKLRQPLAEAAFFSGRSQVGDAVQRYADLLREELNVKNVRVLDALEGVVRVELKPLPMQLGQKYQDQFPAVRTAIQALSDDDVRHTALALFAGEEGFPLIVSGERLLIMAGEVEVEMSGVAGYVAAADGPMLAAVQSELSPALELEGLAREVVRRIQELRKQADFDVDDRIELQFKATSRLQEAIEAHRAYIQGEILAERMLSSEEPSGERNASHSFEGEDLEIAVRRRRE